MVSDGKNGNGGNLPAKAGEFTHTFTKSGEVKGPAAGIIAIPFMAVAFLFFVMLGFLMLVMGGIAALAGKPGKVNFKYHIDKRPDFFGARKREDPFQSLHGNKDIIDVEATEITDKENGNK